MASSLFSSAPQLNSHRDVLELNRQRYREGVQNGSIRPTVYPSMTYGLIILILFFLIPPTSCFHNKFTRYVTFTVASSWHLWLILTCKAYGPSVSFGIGIVAAWGILWAAVTLVFHDAKTEWRRVKREESWTTKGVEVKADQESVVEEKRTVGQSNGNAGVVKERKVKSAEVTTEPSGSVVPPQQTRLKVEEQRISYRWQSYPAQPFGERFVWAIDCLTNMRGVGWNWKIAGLPTRPWNVEASLRADENKNEPVEDRRVSRNGIPRFDTFWSVLTHNYWLIVKGYLTIDLIKVINNHDPYFWGLIDRPPPTWLPYFIQASPAATRMYRLFFSMTTVWVGLRTLYCFAPMFFVGLVGKEYLGSIGEPWLYPDNYGGYANVFTRGLAGWWGGWWHQVFRYGFEAAGKWLTMDVLRLRPKSQVSNMIQLFVAFLMSGLLHASGSKSMIGDTRPLQGSLMFFLCQPLGIMMEMAWHGALKQTGLHRRIPPWLGATANFIWVHGWFWMTGPLLTDDFAKGGLWLFEPIMLSPLRGLGFGVEGDGFYCWGGRQLKWHSDEKWWLSGIAL